MMSAWMCRNSGRRMCSMFASEPVSKLSTQIDAIASRQQVVAQMRAEEAGPAGDEACGHAQPSLAAGMTGTSRVR